MTVLVTGAAGFLGIRLVTELLANSCEVIATDRCPLPDQLSSDKRITWIERDIAKDGMVADEICSVDTVFHLAGATLGAGQDELLFLEANEMTTVKLLQACAEHVKKVIFASSQVVYGDVNHTAVTEKFSVCGLGSAYACSKFNSENWLKWFQKKYGGIYISLRYCGFIEGGGIIDYMLDQALNNKAIEVYSKGSVVRDYLPVEKGIAAFMLAYNGKLSFGFEAFNIGSGQLIRTSEMAALICTEANSQSEIIFSSIPAPQTDFVFCIDKAKSQLGFEPGSLSNAIRDYVQLKKSGKS